MNRQGSVTWWLVGCGLALVGWDAAPAWAVGLTYADFNAFTGDVTTLAGDLGGNPFTMTITNGVAPAPVTSFVARAGSSRFDNGSTAFADGSIFTPALGGTDLLGLVMNHASTDPAGLARVRIAFQAPVTDLTVHVTGLDRAGIDFGPTTNDVVRMGGTAEFNLNQTLLTDLDPASTGERGSVRIEGTYSVIELDLMEVVDLSDGFQLQFSATLPGAVPLFGPLGLLGLGVGLAGAGGSLLSRREA